MSVDLAKKSIRVTPLLFAMVCIMMSGCSREEFSIQRVDAFPTIIATYAFDSSLTISEGLSLAVLPVSRGSGDYFVTVVSPSQDWSWESQAVIVAVDGIEYLGVPDLILPSGFPFPEGLWALQLLHADGRVIEHSFQILRNAQHRAIVGQSELWIPRVFWSGSSDERLILTMEIPADSLEKRSLQDMWNIQFLDANGAVVTTIRAQEGILASRQVSLAELKRKAVKAVCSRYDDSSGCLLIGLSIL